MIDDYVDTRQNRLTLDKAVAELKKAETLLKETIIREFYASDVHMVGGSSKKVTLRVQNKPMVNDWDAFNNYVLHTGQTVLYQKRISEGVANEMIENGEEIPGVELYEVNTLSVSKL